MDKVVTKKFCDIQLCENEAENVCMVCGKDICRMHSYLFGLEGGLIHQVMGTDVIVTGFTCIYCEKGFKKKLKELFKKGESK